MTRFLRIHPRLLIATAIGMAVFLFLRSSTHALTASLVGWSAGCWSWIVMIMAMITGPDASRRNERSGEEDVAAWVVLVFVCTAALVSMAAVVFDLAAVPDAPGGDMKLRYLVAAATVAGSWVAVGLAFTLHYAHMYFTSGKMRKPLRFPDESEKPAYWDFIYFAFTISVAAQTSDVSVMTTEMRRLVIVQSVLGFIFNAAIIGFSINVFASAVGKG